MDCEQIKKWYRNLVTISPDDKADLEVLLLDQHNPTDAEYAIVGLMENLLHNGYNSEKIQLMMHAGHIASVKRLSIMCWVIVLLICIMHDHAFRKDDALIENYLDVLEQESDMLHRVFMFVAFVLLKHAVIYPKVDIRNTLIYRLMVVGKDANQAFDQSCC